MFKYQPCVYLYKVVLTTDVHINSRLGDLPNLGDKSPELTDTTQYNVVY